MLWDILNQLLKSWGVYLGLVPPFMPHRYAFCWVPVFLFALLQAVGYSLMPNNKDEDGLVVLVFNRKETDIRSQQQQLVESLHKILGGNQTLTVNIEGVKTMPDDQYVNLTQFCFFLQGCML